MTHDLQERGTEKGGPGAGRVGQVGKGRARREGSGGRGGVE